MYKTLVSINISLVEKLRSCLIDKKFSVFFTQTFLKQENTFSYENYIKKKLKNKENEFTIFNILYMNQKTVLCYFSCFRIKSKTRDLVDLDKTKTWDCGYFLLFFPFCFHFDFILIRLTKTQDCK